MTASVSDNSYSKKRPRPVVLLLIDGWGIAPVGPANAIDPQHCPVFNRLLFQYPVAILQTAFKNPMLSYLTIGTGRPAFSVDSSYDDFSNLAKLISAAGLRQALIAESEKFALVSYFFKGKNSQSLLGEDNFVIPSLIGPYQNRPELVLKELTSLSLKKIKSGDYDFILINIANLDLLASSGNAELIPEALSLIDRSIEKISKAVLDMSGALLIGSAHGNAERIMNLATEEPDREITDNPVPFLMLEERLKGKTIGLQDVISEDLSLLEVSGSLSDIAPSIIKIMNLSLPDDIKGSSLL